MLCFSMDHCQCSNGSRIQSLTSRVSSSGCRLACWISPTSISPAHVPSIQTATHNPQPTYVQSRSNPIKHPTPYISNKPSSFLYLVMPPPHTHTHTPTRLKRHSSARHTKAVFLPFNITCLHTSVLKVGRYLCMYVFRLLRLKN